MALHLELDTSWEQALLQRAAETYHSEPAIAIADNQLLEAAYKECSDITRQNSKSFYIASNLLPYEKQQAVRALYAFCRITDDIVDTPGEDRAQKLREWRRRSLDGVFPKNDLVAAAWSDARCRFDIPAHFIAQLIDGVATDINHTQYENFAQLAEYAYGVASTVGLMSMHIIGFDDTEATHYAIKLGVALQMTNILRDVGQDYAMGRVYLPQDELEQFGITEQHFEQGIVDDAWRSFMRFQLERNRQLYNEAQPGIAMLHKDGRLSIAAAAALYGAILEDIEQHDYDVFSRRAFVSQRGKLKRIPSLWWQVKRI